MPANLSFRAPFRPPPPFRPVHLSVTPPAPPAATSLMLRRMTIPPTSRAGWSIMQLPRMLPQRYVFTEPAVSGAILEVDWDGDGSFGGLYDHIEGDTMVVECVRGRDYASQLTGRAVAGQLQATLRNDTGRYSSFNASSPIYGGILPGRKVRLRVNTPVAAVLWTGFLDRIQPSSVSGPYATATLYASGPFIKLAGPNSKVSPPAQANVQTGDVVDAILDDIGWPAGARSIQSGTVEIGRWFIEEDEALAALQDIEDTEQGFIYEGTDWDIRYEGRYDRTINHLTSEATYSDHNGATYPYMTIEQQDPLREIFNVFEATVQPYQIDDVSVLWTLSGEIPTLAAGASRTYIAKASQLDGEDVAYVESWTTPVVGTDITQTGVSDGDIGVSVSKTALTMFITVTNNHGSAAATLTMQARGIPVLRLNPFKVSVEDATSKATYGRRLNPLPSTWYFNSANAEGTGEYLIDRYANPRPILSLSFASKRNAAMTLEMVTRQISDRVTIQADNNAKLGIDRGFYVEGISHRFSDGNTWHETSMLFSPADDDPGWFVLDESTLNGSDVLAY